MSGSQVSEIQIRDVQGNVLERREIGTDRPRLRLLKQAILRYEANRRAGTAATKVRSQVVGSRRKPWRQKGTGRARHGDRRSPIWRGGGVIFGPHPRSFSQKLPRRARREAIRDALQGKVRDSQVVGVESYPTEPPKTREMADLLKRLGIEGTCLIAVGPAPENPFRVIHRMARNIPGVKVIQVENLNALDLLRHRTLLVDRAGVDVLFPPASAEEG
jgi:large subunit ribosomal protein L4